MPPEDQSVQPTPRGAWREIADEFRGLRREIAETWTDVSSAASPRRAFHATFVASARSELALWRRCGPGLRQVIGARLGSDSAEVRDLVAGYRRAAVHQQAAAATAAETILLGYSIPVLALAAALLIGTYSFRATPVLLVTIFLASVLTVLLTGGRFLVKAVLVATALLAAGCLQAGRAGLTAGELSWDLDPLSYAAIFALALFAAGSWILFILLSSMVLLRVSGLRVRALQRRQPEVGAIACLLEVIDRAGPIRFRDKDHMIACLARAASLIETAVPKSLRLPEPAQRLVYADRCRATAASLRSLMLWVALPGPTTRTDLIRVCQDTVYALMTGRLDELPALAGDPRTRRQRLRTVLSVARTLVTGAIPVLVLIGVRQAGVVVRGTLGDAATIFAIGWAVVVYLQLIDPLMTQRLSSMKDLIGTLRGGLGGK